MAKKATTAGGKSAGAKTSGAARSQPFAGSECAAVTRPTAVRSSPSSRDAIGSAVVDGAQLGGDGLHAVQLVLVVVLLASGMGT